MLTRGEDKQQSLDWTDVDEGDLMEGDVTVAVNCSTMNYKDGLALTGSSPVVRRWPMIPGIDFAGTVRESGYDGMTPGDEVVLNGWGVGETHFGGYAEVARVPGEWLVPKPPAFTAAQTMAIGTAGYTAMLCVLALEDHGVTPEDGPVLVTGAAGGGGSVGVSPLSKAPFEGAAANRR